MVAQARALGIKMRTLAMATGRTSTVYDDLKQGSVAYNNMITGVTRGKEIAEDMGYKFVVLAVLCKHGESDAANASYEADLVEWQSDVETDIQAITGQAGSIPLCYLNLPHSKLQQIARSLRPPMLHWQ